MSEVLKDVLELAKEKTLLGRKNIEGEPMAAGLEGGPQIPGPGWWGTREASELGRELVRYGGK